MGSPRSVSSFDSIASIRLDADMTNKQLRQVINYITYNHRAPRSWKEDGKTLYPSIANKAELETRLRILLSEHEDLI